MSLLQRSAIVTAMLAALSVPVFAQPSPADAPAATTTQAAPHGKHHRPDPQARKARMEQRMQARGSHQPRADVAAVAGIQREQMCFQRRVCG